MTPTASSTRPLWQRLLLRRLKFLAWLVGLLVLLVGGSYLLAPQWLVQAGVMRQAMVAHVDNETVHTAGGDWSYYIGGSGPSIVLLHGFGTDKTAWLEVAAPLTAHFQVIIPDLPGWGESAVDPAADQTIEAQAVRLDDFMRALDVRNAVLVGHGTGAAVAAVYAAEHPDRIRELALLDAYGLTSSNAFNSAATAHRLFVYDDPDDLKRANAVLYAQPPSIRGQLAEVRVRRNQRDRVFIERALATLRQPAQLLVVQKRLSDLTMPVLGLWCHDDKVIDRAALEVLRNGLAHASTISTSTISGCAHLPMLEKPAETAQILTGFALSH